MTNAHPEHLPCDVSVVVPVYNPGRYLDPCIRGLLEQSIDRRRMEVIFIDDGSTDETPARLDQLAAEHHWIHVVHQANSGWPGQPRNRGMDLAQGDYIFFNDHDDRLGPEALERMVARARQTGADILVPKGVSFGRPVPRGMFRTNLDRAILGVDPLSTSTTPHKLFRRAFLGQHNLRYPEGKRRLEDGVFVMSAYLKADVISVLADYPCYYRYARDDGQNTALQSWAADYYFPFVAEIIDVIEAGTEPGELRDALLLRPYDTKMLSKLVGKRMFRWSPDHRQAIFDEVRALVLTRFPAGFHETNLSIVRRAHARALVSDRLDRMIAVAECVAGVRARAVVHRLGWEADHLIAEIEAELVFADGTPITMNATPEGWTFDHRLIPADLAGAPHPLAAITAGQVDVTVKHRHDKVEWFAESDTRVHLIPMAGGTEGARRVVFRTTARINPSTVAGNRPINPGLWDVQVRVGAWGLDGSSRLARAPHGKATVSSTPCLLDEAGIRVVPEMRQARRNASAKTLRLRVATSPRLPVKLILRRIRQPTITPVGDLAAAIDLTFTPSEPVRGVQLLVIDPDDTIVAKRPADIAITATGSRLTSDLAGDGPLPPGRLRIAMKSGRRVRLLGEFKVDEHGQASDLERRKPKPIAVRGTAARQATDSLSIRRRIGARRRADLGNAAS